MKHESTQQQSEFSETLRDGLCCPDRAYRGDAVAAIVRVSHSMRFIFADGRTLTLAPKTRYATFPRVGSLLEIVDEAKAELREKHPLTRNLWVEINTRVIPTLTLQT